MLVFRGVILLDPARILCEYQENPIEIQNPMERLGFLVEKHGRESELMMPIYIYSIPGIEGVSILGKIA